MEQTPYVTLPIPVSAAEEICYTYGYDQVFVYARRVVDEDGTGAEHLTTFGRTDAHSNLAAQIGFYLRTEVMGWYGDHVMSRAMVDVLDERRRQQGVEGWTPEHDDTVNQNGELARAAAVYASEACVGKGDDAEFVRELLWPWSQDAWKPKGSYRDLARAAALIIAEMERLNRAAKKGGAE